MKSIQSKILIVVISGLLVITAIVSAIAVTMTHGIMHKDADRILNNATQKEAAAINDVLGDVMKSSSIMKHYTTSELKNPEDLLDDEFCDEYIKKAEIMFSEIVSYTSGIYGYYLRIDPKFSNGTTGFYKTRNQDGTILDMPITDLNKYDKDDKKNVGWYYEAVNATTGIWLDPYSFPGTESKLISYTQPIYVQNQFVGVIGFDMDFTYLVDKINDINVYEYGYATLLAKDEKTVYNEIPDIDSNNPHTQAKAELKNGMYLTMHADYKDIQKDIHPMLQKIVFAFIAVLFCSIIYTVIVTKKIVGPLKRLTAAAENLSEMSGSSDYEELVIESNDEIGTLAKALTHAYSKIQEYMTYINALAYRDSLTGIKNSTAYTEAIAELNHEILTGNPKFGILVADINNLKETNDKYGHDIGNDLIVRTSKILTNIFENSAVYRIGGDEFVVILQGDDYKQYHSLLDKIDEACSHDYITVSESTITVAVACGVSLYDPSIDRVYEDVFSKADHAMYMNKQKSKVVFKEQ